MMMVMCNMAKEQTRGPSSSVANKVQDRRHLEPEEVEGYTIERDNNGGLVKVCFISVH